MSFKRCLLKQIEKAQKALEGPKPPSEEELERDGIRVVIGVNRCCKGCFCDLLKCCKAMPGVSKVDLVDGLNEKEYTVALTGVFSVAKLKEWFWNRYNRVIRIVEEEKIGGGGAAAAGVEQEEEEEVEDYDDDDEIFSSPIAEISMNNCEVLRDHREEVD